MSGSFGQASTDPSLAWARVQLVRGQSGGATWAIDSQYAEARLSIGSAPEAGWPVLGTGVMPVHFELFWDGRSLWIADTRRAGGVALNGRAVGEWVQIRGRAEVSFGAAAMVIETSSGAPLLEMASNPGQATRLTLAPETIDRRGTGSMQVAQLTEAPGESWDPLRDESTRIAEAPSERPHRPLEPERTQIASAARPPPPPPPRSPMTSGAARPRSETPGVMRPRLGGEPPAVPAPREAARPSERTSPHVAEPTRIAASPADAADGTDSTGPLLEPMATPSVIATAPPTPSPLAPPNSPPSGGFAAPPTFDQAHAAQQKPGALGGKGKQALPARTWILLTITVLAAAGIMVFGPGEDASPEAGPTPGAVSVAAGAAAPAPAAGTPGAAVPATAPAGGAAAPIPTPGPVPAPMPGAAAPIPVVVPAPMPGAAAAPIPLPVPAPMPGAAAAPIPVPSPAPGAPAPSPAPGGAAAAPIPLPVPSPAPVPSPSPRGAAAAPIPVPEPVPRIRRPTAVGPTEDRIAADLVIAGRWDEALPRYQMLAARHPDRPEYGQMVRILQRRLSNRCQGGIGLDGRACTP